MEKSARDFLEAERRGFNVVFGPNCRAWCLVERCPASQRAQGSVDILETRASCRAIPLCSATRFSLPFGGAAG
jgi:hypothetical protein